MHSQQLSPILETDTTTHLSSLSLSSIQYEARITQEVEGSTTGSMSKQAPSSIAPNENHFDGPTKKCIACLEILSLNLFPEERITSVCDHSSSDLAKSFICKSCLSQHIQARLEEHGPKEVSCPICRVTLSFQEVQKWATTQTFRHVDRLLTRQALALDPNFIWCCNPRCEAGQVHVSGVDAPIVTCHSCNSRGCFYHQVTWHEGLTCEEFDNPGLTEERHLSDLQTEQAIRNQELQHIASVRLQIQSDEEIARNLGERETHVKASRRGFRRQQAEERRIQQQVEEEWRSRQKAEGLGMKRLWEEQRQKKPKLAKDNKKWMEERSGELLVLKSSRPCPGPGCSYRISKADGCNHMTCKTLSLPV